MLSPSTIVGYNKIIRSLSEDFLKMKIDDGYELLKTQSKLEARELKDGTKKIDLQKSVNSAQGEKIAKSNNNLKRKG